MVRLMMRSCYCGTAKQSGAGESGKCRPTLETATRLRDPAWLQRLRAVGTFLLTRPQILWYARSTEAGAIDER